MDRNKLMSILKSVVIILAILAFVSFLRFQSAELSTVPPENQDYFRFDSGLPYFTEMDSYYNLRMTQDFISHGHLGSEIRNGTPWDTLSYAPEGRSAEYTPMIAYVTSFLYYLADMFFGMSLKEVAFYTTAIISPLVAIPAFIIVRRATNNYGAATAAIMVSLAPNYFSHSFAGFFDTDMFNVVLPLFLILFFIESIRASKLIYRIIFILLSIGSMILFSLSWQGYIFYIAMLVIFMILYLILGFILKIDLIQPLKKYPNIFRWFINQKELFSILLMAIIGFIGLGLVNGFESVLQAPMSLFGFAQMQDLTAYGAFPNVAISIAELQIPTLLAGGIWGAFLANSGGVVNGMGGIVATFGAIAILILLTLRLFKLRSIKILNYQGKKPPKGQREATSKVKEGKSKKSLIGSIMENIKTRDDLYRSKREILLYLTLFGTWILLSAVAVTQGSRFIAILMIPMGLCAGLFVGYLTSFVKNKLDDKNILMALAVVGSLLAIYPVFQTFQGFFKLFNISLTLAQVIPIAICLAMIGISALLIYGFKRIKSSKLGKTAVMIIITLAIISPSVFAAYQVVEATVPSSGDSLWDSMTWTKANTPTNTVIASWWDFGYLFQIASERATLFDGGSQGGERAFWVGYALKTNDTELSAAIFEMLAYSGDNATFTLINYTNDSRKSVEILKNTLTLPADEAKDQLMNTYNLTSAQADNIVNMTHPENPTPVVTVLSQDMIQKAYWWSFFGNWDFEAQNSVGYSYMVSNEPVKAKSIGNGKYQANLTNLEQGGIQFKTVITTGAGNNTTNATTAATFENGTPVIINKTAYNPFKINRLILIEDNIIWRNETINASANHTLLIIGDNRTYTSIIMSKELENAMFTKLYILGGFGQDAYELIHTESGVSLWKNRDVPTLKNDTRS